MNIPRLIVSLACVGVIASLVGEMASAKQQPVTPPATQPSEPKPAPPSSLDDLLDLDEERPADQAPQPDDPLADAARRELEKRLTDAEVANAFVQAIDQMSVAAELLDVRFDTGVNTQRVQEDIIAKLAQLLDQAKRNQSNSSSSSSSSSSQQQQSQQQQSQQNPGQRPQNPNQQDQQGDDRNQNPADNRSELTPPSGQDANPNGMLEESRTEWGNLPQRLRDQLIQGRRDYMPALYRRMIDEYYRRLAEENVP